MSTGSWNNTKKWLRNLATVSFDSLLKDTGEQGVKALIEATPKYSGLASSSWYYVIEKTKNSAKIIWHNRDIEGGYNVALLIQYGHGTKGGSYIQGVDYINPPMNDTFKYLSDRLWEEVNKI